MTEHRDPVDSALDTLRSEDWTAQSYNPDLENRLMQHFGTNDQRSRFRHPRTVAIGVALLAVSGVTFAATGGVETIRSWFVTVEINGQQTEVALDPNGEAEFDIQTDDGDTANIHIQRTESADQGHTMRIDVCKTDDANTRKEVVRMVRGVRPGLDQTEYTLDDLGSAEPLHTWQDARGGRHEVYILPGVDGEGSRVFLVSRDEADSEPSVRLIASPQISLLGLDGQPDVSVDEQGLISIRSDDGQGRAGEIKLRIAAGESAEDLARAASVATPDGQIKITVQPSSDDP